MGIQGLLPAIKSATAPVNVKEYSGMRAAVDTYSWLHKAAFSCSKDICHGLTTTKFIDYCMHRVNLLRHHGVKPLLVFDGGKLPMKNDQDDKRSRARRENLQRALEFEAAGNHSAAYDCYQKAVDITPEIAFQLIQVLRVHKVDFIVAPYEADAQMAYLSSSGLVDVVITEDSDLVAYGCSRILFKMDKFGQGVEFQYADLVKTKDLNFTSFTKKMVLEMCILSGCDYLPSLPGMGIKRAHNLLKRFRSYQKVIKHLRFSGVTIPRVYEDNFENALFTFCHQLVYDPVLQDATHLTKVPDGLEDLKFLGPRLSQNVAKQIAEGFINPVTYVQFQDSNTISPTRDVPPGLQIHVKHKHPRQFDLPAQKNVLTNYFISKSEASKQQFKTPRLACGEEDQTFPESPRTPTAEATDSDAECVPTTPVEDLELPHTGESTSSRQDEVLSPDLATSNEHLPVGKYSTKVVIRSRYFPLPEHGNDENNPEEDISDSDHFRSLPVQKTAMAQRKRSSTRELKRSSSKACKLREVSTAPELGRSFSSTLLGDDMVSLSANVDHVKEYSSIAQASIDKFTAAISSFKCGGGARVSGLRRPPLKTNLTNIERTP